MQARRWSYLDCLDGIEEQLLNYLEHEQRDEHEQYEQHEQHEQHKYHKQYEQHGAALAEARLLRDYFAAMPATKVNFGLVHYDFEYDNVFYDSTSEECYAIDFDDAMYHWYAMDIEQALKSAPFL